MSWGGVSLSEGPSNVSSRQVHATGGEKIVEAMQPGGVPESGGDSHGTDLSGTSYRVSSPAGLLCEKRARVNAFDSV